MKYQDQFCHSRVSELRTVLRYYTSGLPFLTTTLPPGWPDPVALIHHPRTIGWPGFHC